MQCVQSTRRRFITLLSGLAATTPPLATRAQQPAMGAASIAARPDNPANGLDPFLQQAQALGAPMAALARAVAISRQSIFPKKRRARGLRYLAAVGEQKILRSGFQVRRSHRTLCGAWENQWTKCKSLQIQRLPKRSGHGAAWPAQDCAFRSHGPLQDHRGSL